MQPFITHTGRAVSLRRAQVDTDQIIPAEYLKRVTRTGFGDGLFAAWRADPGFVLNQPQAAILGVGKLERRAVVVGEGAQERIVVQPRCYVTLTLDHRVMDGHQANRFMQVFVDTLAHWHA